MAVHVIANPVPTPEQMGRILGLSSERVAGLRTIMNAPAARKRSKRATDGLRVSARRRAGSRRTSRARAVR